MRKDRGASTVGSPAFREALAETLRLEGGRTNHAWDPGGDTQFGIARNRWPDMWRHGPPTLDQAIPFYHREFWLPLRLDDINSARVRMEVFDTGVNTGICHAAKFLQKSVNDMIGDKWRKIKVDGKIGPVTCRAVNALIDDLRDNEKGIIAGCDGYQWMYYKSLRNKNAFRGWANQRLGNA